MISPKDFADQLLNLGLDTATGVPDSTFKGLISYFGHDNSGFRHIIAVNECEASGIAAGYHLVSKKPAIVYMQNSGFGKTVNPYTSLASRDVYSIPLLFLIGWRGEPGIKDEPQHKMMGRITTDLLETLEISYSVIDEDNWKSELTKAASFLNTKSEPYAIVIKKGLFEDFSANPKNESPYTLTREEAVELIAEKANSDAVFISTTGKASRELFEIRERQEKSHKTDFYTVGSMGCASSIAFGVGLGNREKDIYIIDGDAAALMQMGTFATVGHYGNNRIKHILIDNNVNDSTGGQPTLSSTVDFEKIASACGYKYTNTVETKEELLASLKDVDSKNELSLLIVKCAKGSRKNLGRPTTTPIENKIAFMENIND